MPENFRKLYEEHASGLFRYCLRFTANAEQAEEVLQDVFERYLAGKYTPEEGANLKSWLYTVARNRCFNLKRASAKAAELVAETEPSASAETELLGLERARSLMKLERSLPQDLRETWALRKQGQDYKTIAKNLSIPLGTVKSRFHRLVEFLRKELGNEI